MSALPPTDSLLALAGAVLSVAPSLLSTVLRQRLSALIHHLTYPSLLSSPSIGPPRQKTVLILGGSFAGAALAQRLAESLPPSHRIVLVERNSHFHYLFAFPRFAVASGHEHKAFLPYDFVAKGAPRGVLEFQRGTATKITDTHVHLETPAGGHESVEWDYLAIATGAAQPAPARVFSPDRAGACAELRAVQTLIAHARSVAIVGAGAVGVELAADIKSFHPDKEVTLIHSRTRVLNQFGERLHAYVVAFLERELGVRVVLGERPVLPVGGACDSVMEGGVLVFSDGREERFDLIIACTGQRPNSALVAGFIPDAVSPATSRVLVHPTLQLAPFSPSPATPDHPAALSRIYALGDVAEHSGPRMARAGRLQADVVAVNIVASIKARSGSGSGSGSPKPPPVALQNYAPRLDVEGSLTLTLGKRRTVLYVPRPGGDVLVAMDNGREDMGVAWAWRSFGADVRKMEDGKEE